MKTYKYLGETITKNEGIAGYALPFSVYLNGQFIYSDCLQGIKNRIIKSYSETCNGWTISFGIVHTWAIRDSEGRKAYARTLKDARKWANNHKASN
jgi:hypothetical protein